MLEASRPGFFDAESEDAKVFFLGYMSHFVCFVMQRLNLYLT